jgi:hypothetical protein
MLDGTQVRCRWWHLAGAATSVARAATSFSGATTTASGGGGAMQSDKDDMSKVHSFTDEDDMSIDITGDSSEDSSEEESNDDDYEYESEDGSEHESEDESEDGSEDGSQDGDEEGDEEGDDDGDHDGDDDRDDDRDDDGDEVKSSRSTSTRSARAPTGSSRTARPTLEEARRDAIDVEVAFDLCFEEADGSAEKFYVKKDILVKMQQDGDYSGTSDRMLGHYLSKRFKLSALVKKSRDLRGQFYTGLRLSVVTNH